MPRDRWFQPPRRVLILFVAVTMVPSAALAWLSWQLLRQDRALESQRLQERLDHAADLIGSALDRQLTEVLDRLPALAEPSIDALAVTCLPHGIEVNPKERLLYYPVVTPPREPRPGTFEAGETLEFRQQNHAAAIAEFRRLAGAADPIVRGGALVRLGRNLRKAGRQEEALEAYERLAQLDPTMVSGVPAELLAGEARLAVLQSLGRAAEVEEIARGLSAELRRGRWVLDRATFEFHSQEVERRLAAQPGSPEERRAALALAAAVESLWGQWQAIRRGEGRPRGRRSVWVEGRSVLVAWTSVPDTLTALVAGPSYVESRFSGAWQGLGVALALVDADSHDVRGGTFTADQPQAVRTMADTGLPWTLRVASANPVADLAELAGRRRLLLAGLAMMGLVVAAGSYFTARAVTRELAVARLQSDFVSAVSHEFRTPLTSMRHLTELLDRGVVSEEERRKQYYAALSHETTRLHRLVESLLNFGRMEAGALEYRFEMVNLANLVEEVVTEFERDVCAGDSRIELSTAGPMSEVPADREAMGRAVWNLLDNAVKYSPRGTSVSVEVAGAGGHLFIRVRDEGPGIPADERKQIFKKFVRGAQARASHVKGTGIGLAMVQHIVRAHHGEIRLDGQPGKGSTFSIVLPVEGHAP